MTNIKTNSFLKILWKSAKKDVFLGLPWIPIYSFSEVILAVMTGSLIQLIFSTTPRISVIDLVPGKFKEYIHFGQTLDRRDIIFVLPILIVTAAFIKLISSFMSSYLTERAGHKIAHSLREEMLRGYLSSAGNRLDQTNPDSVANQLMQDTSLLQGAISKGTISAGRDFLVLLGIIVSMLLISWGTFLIGVCVIVPLALLLRKISRKLNFYTREGQKRQIELSTRILLSHNGALTVNALRSHAREEQDFEELNQSNYKFMRKSLFVRTFFSPSTEFFAMCVLAILFAWRLSYTGDFSASTYSSMLILLAFSYRYIKNIASTITFFSEIRVVLNRVKTFLGDYLNKQDVIRPRLIPAHSTEVIEANNVGYTLESGKKILELCSIKILKGSRIAFVGESGAGKTTFLRILAGLVFPSCGEVKIVPDFLLASQFPYVFKGTVKENIIYSDYDSFTDFEKSIADERAKDLVLALKLAFSDSGAQLILDKRLGFLGDGLSGGEKARVALARTMYAKPKLILLDEPTANLDADSANLFWQAIFSWQEKDSDHTVVAVSHALHEVKDFDYCYVFEDGKIVKQGKPSEILLNEKQI